MDSYAIDTLIFLGGFVSGAIVCLVVMAQIYKHRKIKDEILKSKRQAVRAQRKLDRFLKTSLDMFNELDSAHRQYVQFLRETSQKIAPQEAEAHAFLNAVPEETPVKRMKDDNGTIAKDITGTLDVDDTVSINPPNVLKNPHIPESVSAVSEITEEDSKTVPAEEIPEEEKKDIQEKEEQEQLKV